MNSSCTNEVSRGSHLSTLFLVTRVTKPKVIQAERRAISIYQPLCTISNKLKLVMLQINLNHHL